mmetsp:Transcript_64876/g.186411  ORF Transcript_64876/g.186411 Transcript_64876/m.186411 type:complete len:236 (+) Transcript_64876:193-900(+)
MRAHMIKSCTSMTNKLGAYLPKWLATRRRRSSLHALAQIGILREADARVCARKRALDDDVDDLLVVVLLGRLGRLLLSPRRCTSLWGHLLGRSVAARAGARAFRGPSVALGATVKGDLGSIREPDIVQGRSDVLNIASECDDVVVRKFMARLFELLPGQRHQQLCTSGPIGHDVAAGFEHPLVALRQDWRRGQSLLHLRRASLTSESQDHNAVAAERNSRQGHVGLAEHNGLREI